MIELRDDTLQFRFPEVHPDARCRISCFRTLRIPDDDSEYYLPPGLGEFPLKHVDDHLRGVPASWKRHGGVFLPMYQAEAMWINFEGGYPMAVKIAAGKVSALTGEPWNDGLTQGRKQDYVVIPDQPWLDGFFAGKGVIRQFVAMPLGMGLTAEEQLTGKGEHGGLQVVVYPMKAKEYEKRKHSVTPSNVACNVRRAKALAPSGCEARPANCRSSRKPSERVMEVTTWTEALRRDGPPSGRLSEHAGRNASERRAGLEKHDAEADPPLFRGRQPASGKRATRAPGVSAGVLATACVQEGDRGNTGSPVGGVHAPTGLPRGTGRAGQGGGEVRSTDEAG